MQTRDLLEKYSHIPPSEQIAHIYAIRDEAFAIRAYPCTGLGSWLVPYLAESPAYPDIVQRVKNGETLLDIGCFLGSDLRRLVFDGAGAVPSGDLIGMDIVSHWDIGFNLFRDRDTFHAKFLEADLLAADTDPRLVALKGEIGVIHISAVLHQWDLAGQLRAVKKLISLSRPGTLVAGYQIGNVEAKHVQSPLASGSQLMRHNDVSFNELWQKAGEETGTAWEVKARLIGWAVQRLDQDEVKFMEHGDGVLDFVVRRLR